MNRHNVNRALYALLIFVILAVATIQVTFGGEPPCNEEVMYADSQLQQRLIEDLTVKYLNLEATQEALMLRYDILEASHKTLEAAHQEEIVLQEVVAEYTAQQEVTIEHLSQEQDKRIEETTALRERLEMIRKDLAAAIPIASTDKEVPDD